MTSTPDPRDDALAKCDHDPATAIVEELVHTSPFYIMEDARQKWIEIVHRGIAALSAPPSQSESDDEKLVEAMEAAYSERFPYFTRYAMRAALAVARKALTPSHTDRYTPCPTCGFHVERKEPTPFVFEDDAFTPSQSDDDLEVERILALSDEEILAEVRAEGRDPVQVANEMRNTAEAVIYATRVARELVGVVIGQGDAALPTVVHALLYARNAALYLTPSPTPYVRPAAEIRAEIERRSEYLSNDQASPLLTFVERSRLSGWIAALTWTLTPSTQEPRR